MPRAVLAVLALVLALGLVPACNEARSPPPAAQRSILVDLNSASLAELKALPEIGDAYAERIVRGRPYDNKRQLVSRDILPERVYDRVAPLVIARQRP